MAIMIIYFVIKAKGRKEGFNIQKKLRNPNIVFLGNYEFNQPKSVKYPSLKELIHEKIPLANIKIITNKCFMIKNVANGLGEIPRDWNQKNTSIIISVGSNDIFKNIINCSSNKKVKGENSNLDCIETTKIYNGWANEIDNLKNKFGKANLIILGSYSPLTGKDITVCNEKLKINNSIIEDIDYFNTNIAEYSQKHNINFIPIEKYIKKSDLEKDGITIRPKSFQKFSNILVHDITSHL